jgi:hypothetical protein
MQNYENFQVEKKALGLHISVIQGVLWGSNGLVLEVGAEDTVRDTATLSAIVIS